MAWPVGVRRPLQLYPGAGFHDHATRVPNAGSADLLAGTAVSEIAKDSGAVATTRRRNAVSRAHVQGRNRFV
jgi:hypothetical protein